MSPADRSIEPQQRELELVACELHDGLLQFVIGAHLTSQALRQKLTRQGAEVPEELTLIEQYLENALAEGRRLINELEPIAISSRHLTSLVHQAAAEQANACGAELRVDLELPDFDDPVLGGMLYRIVQESLQNAARHSGATTLEVWGRAEHGTIQLRVSDNGRGFDPQLSRPGHFGLSSMQRRAEILGGQCSIESGPGQGTTVIVQVPMTT